MDVEELRNLCRNLSYRQVQKIVPIGYRRYRRIRDGGSPGSLQGRLEDSDLVLRILAATRERPWEAAWDIAESTGCSARTVQRCWKKYGLSRKSKRLVLSGFEPSLVAPRLAQARNRKTPLTNYPGQLVHGDTKLFGVIKGSKRVYACAFIDNFSAYAIAVLASQKNYLLAEEAAKTFVLMFNKLHVSVEGWYMDNGSEFVAAELLKYQGETHKFTKPASPFSNGKNGKVERFWQTMRDDWWWRAMQGQHHRSLKTLFTSLKDWITWYNKKRQHFGKMNKGLPPEKVISLWLGK